MQANDAPELVGLVLSGGRGTRMGTDKATICYQEEPETIRIAKLLNTQCRSAIISVRDDSSTIDSDEFPQLRDDAGFAGPLAGILTGLRAFPDCALLVLACDMPLVTKEIVETLIESRDPNAEATACIAADGRPEPLCAVYEPRIADRIADYAESGGRSPRELLGQSTIREVRIDDSTRLNSANTPRERAQAEQRLHASHKTDR